MRDRSFHLALKEAAENDGNYEKAMEQLDRIYQRADDLQNPVTKRARLRLMASYKIYMHFYYPHMSSEDHWLVDNVKENARAFLFWKVRVRVRACFDDSRILPTGQGHSWLVWQALRQSVYFAHLEGTFLALDPQVDP